MKLNECFSSITYLPSHRSIAHNFKLFLILTSIIIVAPSVAEAAQPPSIEGAGSVTLVSPIPISPSGSENAPNEIFSWIQTKGADTYIVWYIDGKGKEHVDKLSTTTDVDCSNATLVCKTKTAISISEGMGQWAIRSTKGTENSGWSKTVAFGKSPEGSVFDRCVLPADGSNVLTGDFNNVRMFGGEWSVGTALQAQAIRYDFAKKQAGFNNGVGAGASLRFYKDVKTPSGNIPVSRIKQDCRASTFRLKNENTIAAPLLSITPTIFASKLDDTSDLIVQPAIMLGFFEDILNVGVGFNLTGRPAEVGNVFLLMSLGMGFQF